MIQIPIRFSVRLSGSDWFSVHFAGGSIMQFDLPGKIAVALLALRVDDGNAVNIRGSSQRVRRLTPRQLSTRKN
jgi:hypothetical protein